MANGSMKAGNVGVAKMAWRSNDESNKWRNIILLMQYNG